MAEKKIVFVNPSTGTKLGGESKVLIQAPLPQPSNVINQQPKFVYMKTTPPNIAPTPIKLQPIKIENVKHLVNVSTSTDEKMANTGTMTDKDLVKYVNRTTNTDLSMRDLLIKAPKQKVNYFNEGFKTYYDNRGDVLGVFCFMCCNNCWNRCNNVLKGCKNSVSCPVYCWILFILPLFIALISAIIITFLISAKVINSSG